MGAIRSSCRSAASGLWALVTRGLAVLVVEAFVAFTARGLVVFGLSAPACAAVRPRERGVVGLISDPQVTRLDSRALIICCIASARPPSPGEQVCIRRIPRLPLPVRGCSNGH